MSEVGFSKGCAELALKKPPPLLPSSLIASWLATGPPVSTCGCPARVVIVVSAKLCTTPPARSSSAATNDSGSRIRIVARVTSTQKLPRVPLRERTNPRTRATAIAIPTAAERKFCTARPAIWAVNPSVDSPAYDCQLVLVTNETAVLKDIQNGTPGRSRPIGSAAWAISTPIRATTPTRLKPTTPVA